MRKDSFKFEISLSVLNHLGRNLYRNFITVLGEAISNSWDADAKNVWINIDKQSGVFSIKDDGAGMSSRDFQNKFLRIGYSKRSAGKTRTARNRPYIGAKGIGKLALLSCARRVSIFTRKRSGKYVGGVIDNAGLDRAIVNDLTPNKYPLEALNLDLISGLKVGHRQGTIIVFENTRDQIRNSIAHIKKLLALSFRFSLIDSSFSIYVNGDKVTVADLQDVLDSTQFVWRINGYSDDFTKGFTQLAREPFSMTTALDVSGFVASVKKPRNLKIDGTDERATIDLFVNGRLREKDILKHIPTQRIVESYLYGQLHVDSMDRPGTDPFTSSREGVVEDDEIFKHLLSYLKTKAFPEIFDLWDKYRLKQGQGGDEENSRKSKKERKARDLYEASREEYAPKPADQNADEVESWLDGLRDDAEFNLSSYSDCFLSENLVRKYIETRKIELKPAIKQEASKWRTREAGKKGKANLSFEIRRSEDDLGYLGMDELALVVEGKKESGGQQSLCDDAIAYAPVRNVVGHTGMLTKNAKLHLQLRYENIKGRIRKLLFETKS
ncbi:ATP-binding protein [Xanthomonas campestris]|uniref:ATP-binding protein n=1 Tax=Xanthomonas campestris TaxID=339 RepID=UPI000E0E3AE2|nr:ATP-binding protein [Xanthomonas campestris]